MATTVFESDARYHTKMMNNWTGEDVHLVLDSSGNLTAISRESNQAILTIVLSQAERIYDYNTGFIITVQGIKYKFNFGRRVNPVKSIIFGGAYNWIAPSVNNPLAGVKKQWLQLFEQRGMKIYRDKAGRSVVIGILVGIVFIVVMFAVLFYISSL